MPPPVQQSPQLPFFYNSGFSWEALEGFFCDFCNAQPEVWTTKSPDRVRIVAAELVGRRGDKQNGVDLKLRTDNDETWFIECKHHESWRPGDSREVIENAASRTADRFILALTCKTSEAAKDAIRSEEKWDFWDPETIDQLFSKLCQDNAAAASRLVHRWFGPAWLSAFNLKPSVSLLSTDAYFAPTDQDIFHHRLPLIGRDDKSSAIAEFFATPEQRALIISARGGLGKSRLLREITNLKGKKKSKHTVWFAESGTREQFQAELTQIGGQPVVVIDDAHRKGFSHDLLTAVAHFPEAKVIIGTRPQAHDAMRTALRDNHFTATQISKPLVLRSLKFDDAVSLSEAALGDELKGFAYKLAKLSHDCPLVTIIGAGLIRKDPDLAPGLLKSDDRFHSDVFDKLLQVIPHENRHRLVRLCQWIAAMAPAQNDRPFREQVAKFLDWTKTDVEEAIKELEKTSLLVNLETEGMRVIPDLLSDHLLFEACQDPSTDFVNGVLGTLGTDAPRLKLIRNLAEVDWRAKQEGVSSDAIIAPIWQGYLSEFKEATFVERWRQLREWESFSIFLPSEALELAELTIATTEAPPYEEPTYGNDYDWSSTLKELPKLLEPIARHSDQYRQQALDTLWQLYLSGEIPPEYASAPLNTIARVAEHGSDRSSYLTWLESALLSDAAVDLLAHPREQLAGLVTPLMYYEISRNKVSKWQLCQPLRPQVTELLRQVIERGNTATLLNCLPVLKRGFKRPIPPKHFSISSESLIDAALDDRRANLGELLRLAEKAANPVCDYFVRRAIRQPLTEHPNHRETGEFLEGCRKAVDSIEARGGFELRLVISTFSSEFEEFSHVEDEDELWKAFNQEVCGHLLQHENGSAQLIARLEEFSGNCSQLGFTPRYRSLFHALQATDPRIANELAIHALNQQATPFDEDSGALLSPESRLAMLQAACDSPNVTAVGHLLRAVIHSRIARPFSADEESLILGLVNSREARIIDSVATSLCAGRPKPPYRFELKLLDRAAEKGLDSKSAPGFLRSLAIFSEAEPDRFSETVVEKLLRATVAVKSMFGPDGSYNLKRLSKLRPGAVFELLFARANQAAEGDESGPSDQLFEIDSFVHEQVDGFEDKAERLLTCLQREDNTSYDHAKLLGSLLRKHGDEGAVLVSAWVEKAASESPKRLIELAETLSFIVDYPFWLKPKLVERVFELGHKHGNLEQLRGCLQTSGTSNIPRGMMGGAIDARWDQQIQHLKDLTRRFKGHPVLEPFYTDLLEGENHTLSVMAQPRGAGPRY